MRIKDTLRSHVMNGKKLKGGLLHGKKFHGAFFLFITFRIMRQVITSCFPFLILCGDQINTTFPRVTLVHMSSALEKKYLVPLSQEGRTSAR